MFANVSGLKSGTRYHFRLVAVSSAGTKRSGDRSFKTAKPTTAPSFSPNPVIFSRPFTISGQLVGTGSAHATVTLLARPFPYLAPFAQVGNPVVSNADGTYTFPITAATGSMQIQIKANTNPPLPTTIVPIPVQSLISLHITTHVRKGHLARFKGTVLPAQDGSEVKIQKRGRDGLLPHRGSHQPAPQERVRVDLQPAAEAVAHGHVPDRGGVRRRHGLSGHQSRQEHQGAEEAQAPPALRK